MPLTPHIVGILNITPDSFSDGGKYDVPQAALAAADEMMRHGAEVIDVGAESTRPFATPLDATQEWARLQDILPQIIALARGRASISLDTYHPQTAERALNLGVDWINDVCGLKDARMCEVVKSADCRLVAMHSLTVPPSKGAMLPDHTDVVQVLAEWALQLAQRVEKSGIDPARLIYDPGIGFGKSPAQTFALIERFNELTAAHNPWLVGHSRKSFMGGDAAQRDEKTLEISRVLAQKNVAYLRVHDVAAHVKMLRKSQ